MASFGDLTTENTIEGASDGALIGNTGNRLNVSNDSSLLSGLTFNKIVVTYPGATTEIYEYYLGGILKSTVTVLYVSSSKKELTSMERVDV